MRDGEGIRIADFEKRVRDNSLDLLFELDKCADALGPDSPRGTSARALVDRVRGNMVIRPENREMPSPVLATERGVPFD